MNHIRIYILLTHYKHKLQLSDRGIAVSLSDYLDKEVTVDDLKKFLGANIPNNKMLANAYKAEGYKPKEIAEMLGITIYDARYYISNPPKVPYVNAYWNVNFEEEKLIAEYQKRFRSTTATGAKIIKHTELD